MTGVDKTKVLGRLAARDTGSIAGLTNSAHPNADKEAAFKRIIADLGIPVLQTRIVYAKLIKHLQESELTINFIAYKFFNSKPQGAGYVSQFEGGQKWGDGGYISSRDEAEEAMFDYSASKSRPTVPQNVINRIKTFGKHGTTTFEASVRPKYAALNYARLRYGSAGQWGLSHVVLKEHVKHIATYLHTDSFDESGSGSQRAALGGQVANFLNLDRLLINMPPPMLTALNDAANGKSFGTATQVPRLGATSYIEAHVHGEIRFDRDVKKIIVARSELAKAQIETQKLKHKGKPFKVRTEQQVEEVFIKFGAKYGIPVSIV